MTDRLTPHSPELAPRWLARFAHLRGVGWLRSRLHERKAKRWRRSAHEMVQRPDRFSLPKAMTHFGASRYFSSRTSVGGGRFKGEVALAQLIPPSTKPTLSLACGCGHFARIAFPKRRVIGMDLELRFLYIAKYWVAPTAQFVCATASALPFGDDSFAAVFCCDAFHYFPEKTAALQEMRRVTRGTILLVGVQNALASIGDRRSLALTPDGYHALLDGLPHRVLPDGDLSHVSHLTIVIPGRDA